MRPDGSTLPLTPRLFDALLFFVESAGRLLDKDSLLRALWPGLVVEENNLSQVVSALRRALGDDPRDSRYIATVPRYGFRFVAAVREIDDPPSDVEDAAAAGPKAAAWTLPGAVAPPGAPLAAVSPAAAPPSGSTVAGATVAGATVAAVDAAAATLPSRRRWLAAGAAALGGAVAAGWALWPSSPGAAKGGTVSLAVLPFKPIAAEGRDELLEIGMADNLAARLSMLPGLVVRSTSSVLRYGGAGQDARQAARELGVDWIVDGTLLRRGVDLRATVRLLRASDGAAAWSGSFDAHAAGVFEVQDQIAARVQQALAGWLQQGLRASQPLSELGGTRNPQAYQLYLAASWRSQDGRPEGIRRAIELLQQALALDPNYAQAWTELAWIHRRRLWNADAIPEEVFAASEQALSRALAVAPQLPRAMAGRGFARYWFDYDWPGAEADFRRVVQANANVVEAQMGLAYLLLPQGRLDEGWPPMRRARELDPMSPVINTIEASYLIDQGTLDEGAHRLGIALDLAPNLWLAHVARGKLLATLGRPEEAVEALRRAAELGPGTSRPKAVLAAQLAAMGQADEARSLLAELQQRASRGPVAPTSMAMVHAALGDKSAALDALDEAYRWHDVRLVYLKDDPSWRPLYDEPRFVALRKRLKLDGLPPGLTPV